MEETEQTTGTTITNKRERVGETPGVAGDSRKRINCEEIAKLNSKGGRNFFNYLRAIDLIYEPDILVLPSENHFYYDQSEIKNATTIIFQKKLNLVEDLENYLPELNKVLTSGTNFIGYFSDTDTDEDSFLSRLVRKGLTKMINTGPEIILGSKDVVRILEMNGFSIPDMRRIRGLTYFRALKT